MPGLRPGVFVAQEMGARLAAGEILLGRVSKGHAAWASGPDRKTLNPQCAIGAIGLLSCTVFRRHIVRIPQLSA
jgi:hypothetical protein